MFNVQNSTWHFGPEGPSGLNGLKHWRVDLDNLTATLIAPPDEYEVDLEELTTSAAALDWIMQMAEKTWATPSLVAEFIEIIRLVIDPQAALCSYGIERGPINVKRLVQWRRRRGLAI